MTTRHFNLTLLSLYFLSGMISIAFEILWSRYFSLQFGASIFGVIVTVAAFMAGLGTGCLIAVATAGRVKHPLRVFFAMELLVALFALAMPNVFAQVGDMLEFAAATLDSDQWIGMQGAVTLLILFLPACAMGYGFPFVLRAVRHDANVIGKLYGINALGGFIGALAPLALLPLLGWNAANMVIAGLGMLVALAAIVLTFVKVAGKTVDHWRTADETSIPVADLLLYSVVGAGALSLEIAWTRLFGMVMLRTEYVLAIILASFLAGIGLGSLMAARLKGDRWFTILPVVAGLFAVASLWLFAPFSAWVERTPFSSLGTALLLQGALLWLIVLPVTLVLGAWLPLLTVRLGHNKRGGAILYGFNSIGSALGVILTGVVLIPMLGSNGAVLTGALMLCAAGLYWSGNSARQRLQRLALVLVPAALAWPVMSMPQVHELLPLALRDTQDVFVQEDALNITHVIEQSDGQRLLLADLQRMDASSSPEAVTLQQNQARLGLLLRPDAKQVLFLGMGTGITAAMAPWLPEVRARAVELSPGAIRAAREQFAPISKGRLDRLDIVQDDVRHFLVADQGSYDLVIGDLFHPDLVGRGALLTVQHFERVHRRLAPGGIYIQWLSLNQFDLGSLQAVLAGFARVYPDNALFLDGFRLAMVGLADARLNLKRSYQHFAALDESARRALDGGEGYWTWAGRYLGHIPRMKGVAVQDEWAPVIEYRLPRARFDGGLNLVDVTRWLLDTVWEERINDRLVIPPADQYRVQAARSATRIAHEAWAQVFSGQRALGQSTLKEALKANPRDRWISATLANALWDEYQVLLARRQNVKQALGRSEAQVLEAILKLMPDHPGALQRHWQLAEQAGDEARAEYWRERFRAAAPLHRSLRQAAAADNITH